LADSVIKTLEHGFKSVVLGMLALVLRRGDASRWPVDPATVRSVLILRPDKLGDMIVTVPVMRILKERFPHIRVEVLTSPHNARVIEHDPAVDEIHIYEKDFGSVVALIRALRKRRFDIIYDPICHDSATGLLFSHLINRNALLVASRKLKLGRFYDFCEPYEPDGTDHNVDNGLLLLRVLGIDPAEVDPFRSVVIPKASRKRTAMFIEQLPRDGATVIGLNISAGSPTRVLTDEKYLEAMRLIANEHPASRFVIVCEPKDRARGERIRSLAVASTMMVPDGLGLLDAAAIIGRLDALISPDTSLVHIARLAQVPVLALYANHRRNFEFWKPYRQRHGYILSKSPGNIHDIEPVQIAE